MKQTSLKHIYTLAAQAYLDLDDLFKGRWGLAEQKHWGHGLDQAIWSYTEGWEYWYDSIIQDAWRYYGDEAIAALEDLGLIVMPYLDEDSDRGDFDIVYDLKRACAHAYSDGCRAAGEAAFYKAVVSDIEDRIEKVGAPYFCYLKLEGGKFVETPHLYEAERVMFGFTRQWHKDQVLATTYAYDPDEIDSWAEGAVEDVKGIDTDYRLQEGCDDTVFKERMQDSDVVTTILDRMAADMNADLQDSLDRMEELAHGTPSLA